MVLRNTSVVLRLLANSLEDPQVRGVTRVTSVVLRFLAMLQGRMTHRESQDLGQTLAILVN